MPRRSGATRIEAAVPTGSLAFRTAEEALAADGPCEADIAFMTREVTGRSSKDNPTPELKGFETVLRKSPGLKWLQIHPAGAERPIYRELRGRGVKVTTASGATAVTVSHSTLGALIALNRRFPLLADAQRRHAWEPRLGERVAARPQGPVRGDRGNGTDRPQHRGTLEDAGHEGDRRAPQRRAGRALRPHHRL